jgi:hypothetical protein
MLYLLSHDLLCLKMCRAYRAPALGDKHLRARGLNKQAKELDGSWAAWGEQV